MAEQHSFGSVTEADYRRLRLRAQALLADVPFHDAWYVDLPGGGDGRTLDDVRRLVTVDRMNSINPVVKGLFSLRRLLGRLFGWDDSTVALDSYVKRVDPRDVDRSSVAPGTQDGPFRVVYAHPDESVGEASNRTVHAFSVLALRPRSDGYRLFLAIHVAPVGRITPIYMAAIGPFRRYLVYPAILKALRRAWEGYVQ